MRWLRAAFYAAVLACSGCASITTGEFQSVTVNTRRPDGAAVDKAECKLSNDKGFWSVVTPAVANVSRSGAALNVACTKAGEPDGSVMAISRIHGGMVGNLILGGVIGMAIDHASGSGYEYPDKVDVVMGQAQLQDRKDQNAAAQQAFAPAANAVAELKPAIPDGPRTPVKGSDLLDLYRSTGKVSAMAPPQMRTMEFQPDGTVVVDFVNVTRRGLYKVSPGDDRLCMKFEIPNEGARTLPYLNDCFTVYRVADTHFVMRAENSDFEVVYQKPGAGADAVRKSAPIAVSNQKAGPVAASGAYGHTPSGMIFPETAGNFRRTGIHNYDAQGMDVSAAYNLFSPPVAATVYVYRAPQAPSDDLSPMAIALAQGLSCEAEFDKRKREVTTATPQAKLVDEKAFTLSSAGISRKGKMALFEFEGMVAGLRHNMDSLLYLFCDIGANWVVKYRVTYPRTFNPEKQIHEFMLATPWSGAGS